MSTTMTTSDDYVHKSLDDKNMIALGKLKKEWIKLPKELGGKKCKVLSEIDIKCGCNKHNTVLYRLEGKYDTVNCKIKGWMWMNKFTDEEIYSFRIK